LALALVPAFALSTRAADQYEIKPADLQKLGVPMQREIASLQYIMNPYQLRQFFQLPNDDARRAWITRFWLSNDPTPTTPENEMRTEHYLRADIARTEFARPSWPGWDKRGEVMVRYGFPDYRGKMESEVTSRKVHPPGELWFYQRHQMLVRFSDVSLNGNYVYDITPFGDAQDISPDLAEFLVYDTHESIQEQIPQQYLDMYRDPEVDPDVPAPTVLQEAVGQIAQQRYLRPRTAGENEDIGAVNSTEWLHNVPHNPSDIFQRDKAVELAANFEGVLEDTPSSYPFNFEKKACPFYFDVEQFRGGEGLNRVEVNLEVLVKPVSNREVVRRTYAAKATVMDENYKVIDTQTREIGIPVSADSPTRLMPSQLYFTLPRSYYRVAVSVNDVDSTRSSAYRAQHRAVTFFARSDRSDTAPHPSLRSGFPGERVFRVVQPGTGRGRAFQLRRGISRGAAHRRKAALHRPLQRVTGGILIELQGVGLQPARAAPHRHQDGEPEAGLLRFHDHGERRVLAVHRAPRGHVPHRRAEQRVAAPGSHASG
jgi:GWxTD domain-containing protein